MGILAEKMRGRKAKMEGILSEGMTDEAGSGQLGGGNGWAARVEDRPVT